MYVRENEVELKDNVFRLTPSGQEDSFLSVRRVTQDLRDRGFEEELITIRFEKDYDFDSYERETFSILELFGTLGGLAEILTIVGGLFVGIFANRYFNYSIITSLYQIDPSSYTVIKKDSNRVNEIHYVDNDSNEIQESSKAQDSMNQTKFKNNQHFSLISEMYDKSETKRELEGMAKSSMTSRRLYSYKLMDFGYNLLCC